MNRYLSFEEIACAEIVKCINLAFSDYPIPIRLSEEQLQDLFLTSNVNKKLSFGAFAGDEMIGFIMNSSGIYQGEKVVFDVGTGVVPEHRGKAVFKDLFSFVEQKLKHQDMEKYYLEVLQENQKAVQAYQKQGFSIMREFSVLKSTHLLAETESHVSCTDLENFDFSKTDSCIHPEPSYEHSTGIIKMNPKRYAVAFVQEYETVTAFCVFAKENGYIIQMGYSDISHLKPVLEWLLSKFDGIIAKNIDSHYTQLLKLFDALGFVCVTKQFEMAKEINRRKESASDQNDTGMQSS